MNIQRGLVKDLGYEDTECTYVTGSDGVQYYFVNGTMLVDNLYVVTPNVKEAVGHEEYSTLGVLDENCNLIIPCDNKRIELLADRFILVEKTLVEGAEVRASIAVKDDPTQASKYNNDSLNIKRAMENEMGSEGRFVFDDMFSEANLYDFTGKKVLGEDSTGFSFIGQVGKDLYLHTININDSIKAIKTPVEESTPAEPIAPASDVMPNVEPEVPPVVEKENDDKTEVPAENEEISSPVVEDTQNQDQNLTLTDAMATEPVLDSNNSINFDNQIPVPEVENKVEDTPSIETSENVADNVEDVPTTINEDLASVDTTVDTSETKEIDDSRYEKYIPTAPEQVDVKNAVYDEAVDVIRGLLNKTKDLETDVESKGVRIKELELDNKDFVKTIKEQKDRIEKLEKEKEQHVIEIRRQKKSIETLEIEKKDFLRTIEAQSKKLEEQDSKLKSQDEQLSKHESGKEELVKLLENATEVLS